ncbi:MAG: tRNA uridine-5-carboxymethylaminomethyl(34) synthesis GTPase MnmE [Gammaproteobacteria bacterium]
MPEQRFAKTIAARATPPGRGGVAVIRVSGSLVAQIIAALIERPLRPRYAELCDFLDANGEPIDQGLALFFSAPNSFTGEDILELHAHGGDMVTDLLLERLFDLGAHPAEAGEFSQRAFINDKLDLAQAEAIADLIDSGSRTAARAAQRSLQGAFSEKVLDLNARITNLRMHVEAAIDFPEEEIDFLDDAALQQKIVAVADAFAELERTVKQGCLLRDGVSVVLAGRPNAGKSSLLNALAGYDAAIVTDIPGTTRDLVRETLDLDGLPVRIVDTAGLRASTDVIEKEGVRRAKDELETADHALVVLDCTAENARDELLSELPIGIGFTVVNNKIDLAEHPSGPDAANSQQINVSAKTGAGLDDLREHLKEQLGYATVAEGAVTARQRHLESLQRARAHFGTAQHQLEHNAAGELMADELLQVQNALAEITGEFSSDDLLGEIFSNFCIGK